MRHLTGEGGFWPLPVFEGEGGGDGGGDGGGEGGGDGGGDGGGSGNWTPPEGLPKDFVGASADETLGKLLTGFNEANTRAEGLRTKLAGQPAPPKTVDEYKFEPTDAAKPWFGDPDSNPVLPVARAAAHKFGLSNDQFNGFVNEVYGEAAKAGLFLPPLNPAAEIKSYMTARGIASDQDAEAEFEANQTFAKGLLSQLKGLPDDENLRAVMEQQLLGLTDTHEGNLLLHALSARLADSGIRVGGDPLTGEGEFFKKEELAKLSADPRADPKSDKYDENFRKKLDASYAQLDKQ